MHIMILGVVRRERFANLVSIEVCIEMNRMRLAAQHLLQLLKCHNSVVTMLMTLTPSLADNRAALVCCLHISVT